MMKPSQILWKKSTQERERQKQEAKTKVEAYSCYNRYYLMWWYMQIEYRVIYVFVYIHKCTGTTSYLLAGPACLWHLVWHAEISWPTRIHAVLLVSLESSQWVGVHWLGLRLFGATVWKLLIVELFSQQKLNKIKTETALKFRAFLVLLESSQQVRFNRVYFTIFRAKVWKIFIFEWI